MSYNLHGTIRPDNYAEKVAETTLYGPHRVKLSREMVTIMDSLNLLWTLDGGNLMGAYRSGTMLPHDDDFDFVIFTDAIRDGDSDEVKAEYLEDLAGQVRPLLPAGVEVRVVTSYAKKLEVYQVKFGKYPFRDTDYHNVTCDLTLLLPTENLDLLQFQHISQMHLRIKLGNFLPRSTIEYEGHVYAAPRSAKGYLVDSYGYIGEGAVWDEATGLYKKKE